MFSFYKAHNNILYNKLVDLSRNIFFYEKIHLKDNFETRIKLIFIHMSIILIIFREKKEDEFPQDLFDNIFLNIEYHIREQGYGDIAVNKKMKQLLQIFYDILLKINLPNGKKIRINKNIIEKYLEPEIKESKQLIEYLIEYYEKFYYFCFELKNNSVLKGQINFKYHYNHGSTKT
jgi:hypothetical protein